VNEQVIADLQATKARMTPENWNPDGASDDEGRKCILMHLRVVTGDRFRYCAAGNALARHVPDLPSSHYMVVGCYNDRHTTTFEDIQTLLDKTLADLGGLA
jgi:hypothetical protein